MPQSATADLVNSALMALDEHESEEQHQLNARFHHSVEFGRDSSLDFGDYYEASRLLSVTAQFRWDELFTGDEIHREWFLDEIDKLLKKLRTRLRH